MIFRCFSRGSTKRAYHGLNIQGVGRRHLKDLALLCLGSLADCVNLVAQVSHLDGLDLERTETLVGLGTVVLQRPTNQRVDQ
jgi:hypothetical protein